MVFKSKRNLKLSSENLELWLEEFLLSLLISMAAAYKFLRIEISREGEKKKPKKYNDSWDGIDVGIAWNEQLLCEYLDDGNTIRGSA